MTGRQSIEVTRIIQAPVDVVFRWWTEPELLARWMAPRGVADAKVDLRVGGSLQILMKGEGMEIGHTGEYLQVDRPRRLAFTWRSRYTDGASTVTVTFVPEGISSTRLVIVHSDLPGSVADDHRGGWAAMADRLAGELMPR